MLNSLRKSLGGDEYLKIKLKLSENKIRYNLDKLK